MQEILTERPNLFEPNDCIAFHIEFGGKSHIADLVNAIMAAYQA